MMDGVGESKHGGGAGRSATPSGPEPIGWQICGGGQVDVAEARRIVELLRKASATAKAASAEDERAEEVYVPAQAVLPCLRAALEPFEDEKLLSHAPKPKAGGVKAVAIGPIVAWWFESVWPKYGAGGTAFAEAPAGAPGEAPAMAEVSPQEVQHSFVSNKGSRGGRNSPVELA